jgi:ABC-type branched-subunit amino acid transport system substrate-binding protein
VYAGQAAVVMLNAIKNSNGTRAGVTQQIFKTHLPNSITGTIAFNANGDIQGGPVAVYKIVAGKSTDFAVKHPPASLVKAA